MEPVVFLGEDWAGKAAYDPNRDNLPRWWDNGPGLPNKLD